jgi:2-dehydropantoate 2-reductase
MRILVIGAGATGGYFGGRLAQAGRDVTFLVRPQRAAVLARDGLNVTSPAGDIHITAPATLTAATLRQPFDLVILSCKAYDLEAAIADLAPAVGSQTRIVPLLNGMGHLDALDHRFGAPTVLGGQCVISTTLDERGGVVHLNTAHSMTIGARGQTDGRLAGVVMCLSGAGFDLHASTDIAQDMWEKWVVLATMAGGTSLMRAPLGIINGSPGGRDFVLALLDEVVAVATANGHAPRETFLRDTREFLTGDLPQTSSMFRDIEAGGRIEADHIIGDLLRRADAAGLHVPSLKVVYSHLKAYEARRDGASESLRSSA